jgi:signal transduction histidine kinase
MSNKAQGEDLQLALTNQRIFIAQMLHDDVCGNLTALLHDMHWIVHHSDQSVVQERAKISLETVKSALEFSTQVLSELYPVDLQQGLKPAITVLLTRFSHRSGIRPSCTLAPGVNAFPESLQLLIYRTLQEALTNILKHAEATEASVFLVSDSKEVRLQITDNGRGIDAGQSLRNGMGLRSQLDRAQALGGNFDIRCGNNGKGTCIELKVPVAPTQHLEQTMK